MGALISRRAAVSYVVVVFLALAVFMATFYIAIVSSNDAVVSDALDVAVEESTISSAAAQAAEEAAVENPSEITVFPIEPAQSDPLPTKTFSSSSGSIAADVASEQPITELLGIDGAGAILSIASWYPQGNNYIFQCDVSGMAPTSYSWVFGDGQQLLNVQNSNVYHTYQNGIYTAECSATDGIIIVNDSIVVTVNGGSMPLTNVSDYFGYFHYMPDYDYYVYINQSEHTISFTGLNVSNINDHFVTAFDAENKFDMRINYVWFEGWFDTQNLYVQQYVQTPELYSDTAMEVSAGVFYADFVLPDVPYLGLASNSIPVDVYIDTNNDQSTFIPLQFPQLTSGSVINSEWQISAHSYGPVLFETKLVTNGTQPMIELALWVKEDLASNGLNPRWTLPLQPVNYISNQTYINQANGHVYTLTSGPLDILAARIEAQQAGGHLVSINDAAENSFLINTFGQFFNTIQGDAWIGLSDEVSEGSYVWDNGEDFNYSNWAIGEPNNYPFCGAGSEEDYNIIRLWDSTPNVAGVWNDLPTLSVCQNAASWYGIIEISPVVNQNSSANLIVSPYYPQGNNYDFQCNTLGFTPNSYSWNFGDGHQLLNIANSNVYHTYINSGTYNVTCSATDGQITETDSLIVNVAGNNGNSSTNTGGNYSGYIEYMLNYTYYFYINQSSQTITFDGVNNSNQYDHFVVPFDSSNHFNKRINYVWFEGWFDNQNLYLNQYVETCETYMDTASEISPGVYYADFMFPEIAYTGLTNISSDITINTNNGKHTIYPIQYPQLTSTKDVDSIWQTAGHAYGALLFETKLVQSGGQNIIEMPLWVKEDLGINGLNPRWTSPLQSVQTSQATVNLGTAGNFVILSKSGISTTGTTSITGNIGVSPISSTAITGFGLVMDPSNQFATSSLVTGRAYASDYAHPTPIMMTTAVSDMETAYTDAAGRTNPTATELGAGNIGGMTLTPGLYKWGTGLTIPTDVTLNCEGNANAVFIFQVAQTLDISSGKQVILNGGCQANNIFWQVAGQATLGTTSIFNGNILGQTAIVLNNGATLNGRALAQTAVTLDANAVTN